MSLNINIDDNGNIKINEEKLHDSTSISVSKSVRDIINIMVIVKGKNNVNELIFEMINEHLNSMNDEEKYRTLRMIEHRFKK